MLRRCIMFAIGIAVLSTVTFAQNPAPNIPEHLKYYYVFRQLSLLNQMWAAAERRGEDGSRYRQHYKKFASLDDQQMSQLNRIANECLQEVAVYDTRINQLVNETRAALPGKRLGPGVAAPAPPVELKQIDAQREGVLIRAQARLIDAMGETGFRRLNEAIEKSMHVNQVRVGGGKGKQRENSAPTSEGEMVDEVTIIQEVDSTVQLYTATSVTAEVYAYYDPGVEGEIYEAGILKAQGASAGGGPTAEVILTIPALPATEYIGYGYHFVRPIYLYEGYWWYDPYCFS